MNTLTLNHMSTPNIEVVREVLGNDYSEASVNDDLRSAEVIEANHALADYAYGTGIAQHLRARRIDELDKLHKDILAQITTPSESLRRLNPSVVGLIVLRPEVIELSEDYEALLSARGLAIVMNKETNVNFMQYWGMYHHGLIHPDSYMDFPTRTLNYVDKPLRVMIVADPLGVTQGQSVSSYLHSFKGEQGRCQPGTLRGGIAFTALSACLNQEDMLSFRRDDSAIALDPIGAYRHLARNTIPSDGLHNFADSPLLFYAGQAVHVPDNHEVLRDLSILCNTEEVDSVTDALQTNNV